MKLQKLTSDMINSLPQIIVDGNVTLNDINYRYLFRPYIGMYFMSNNEYNSPQLEFNELFNEFITTYRTMYEDSYRTLLLEYNPIENYNSTTETTFGKTSSVATSNYGNKRNTTTNEYGASQETVVTNHGTHTDTDSTTYGTRQENSTTENNPYGYNSNDYSHGDKEIGHKTSESYTDSTQHAYSQYEDRNTITGKERTDTTTQSSDGYTDTVESNQNEHKNVENKHGNIGVLTTQQMLESELKLRQYNLNKWFIDLFAHDNLFYC